MHERQRMLIGLAIAPIGAIVTFILYLYGVTRRGPSIVGSIMWISLFAYPTELVLVLPTHLLLKHWGVSSLLVYLFLGAVFGMTPFIGLQLIGMSYWSAFVGIGTVCGIASALIFWFVAARNSV